MIEPPFDADGADCDGLQRITYVAGEPFLLLTEGRWSVEVRRHARAPWRRSDTIVVGAGCTSRLAYTCDGDNHLVRVRMA